MDAFPARKRLHSVVPLAMVGAAAIATTVLPAAPARAIIVFDPSNYTQNVLTAARTLQQISNQIRSLQNEAQGLINQAKNLSRIGFPEIRGITRALQQIDGLMDAARGIGFDIAHLDAQFAALFPQSAGHASDLNGQIVAAYRQTMSIQAQVVENVEADAPVLDEIVARSQDAEGALQVGQATNQLLALTAKQQFQLQTLMAAQFRSQAIEQARRAQGEIDARAATVRFLGSGSAYHPH